MKKITLSLLSLSLLIASSMPFAGTATFYLLNSSDSVTSTVTITKSSLTYGNPGSVPECAGRSDGIADGLQVNYGGKNNTETKLIVQVPNLPSYCYETMPGFNMPIPLEFYIYTVDNKGIATQCQAGYSLYPDKDHYDGQTIRITETTDHFFCEHLSGIAK